MKKTKAQFLNVGGVSIIMIFMVLCLTMLGALAVSSAYGDLRLTERYKDNVALYYEADSAAQDKLYRLHQALAKDSVVEKKDLTEIIGGDLISEGEIFRGQFIEPMGEKQGLLVKLTLEKRSGAYLLDINSYRVIRTTDETYKSTWNLWDGTLAQ